MNGFREATRADSERRSREMRWRASGRARVEHPRFGCVVVPHGSNFAALLNAAEYWGCDWMELRGAQVWAAAPGDGPTVIPKEFCRRKA